MARRIETFLKIDSLTLTSEFGHYDRVLIDIDLATHLSKTIMLDMDGSCVFASLFYENVLDFCLVFHCVGHDISKCRLVERSLRNKLLQKHPLINSLVILLMLLKAGWL